MASTKAILRMDKCLWHSLRGNMPKLSMYCVVICLHNMHCAKGFAGSLINVLINVLVDTGG